jgi:hypothetical protein
VPAAQTPGEVAHLKESVAVVRTKTFRFDWHKDIEPVEADLERCAADAIKSAFDDLKYLPQDQFSRAVFPNLPAEAAPLSLKSMRVLIEDTDFRERLNQLNLRYIVFIGGHTEIGEAEHLWVGGGGYMAATAVGMTRWDKETDVSALVLDLKHHSDVSRLYSHTEGTSWVAGVLPFVAGVPADTESEACREIASQIAELINDVKTLEAQQ